ncbi:hypothetical protein NQ117_05505 [Paenibacillus sp. SC116]|uniref:hypothetical protein n=1 Tax=Paenibacillus sp. SC116 TaxID=2968986 RepID=UPI00215AE18F|nr:hypothetical protein [Paenibacillus sp. SC116]MCR8843129.1 hypothetical protein [Paenibacillus sp. SC116]
MPRVNKRKSNVNSTKINDKLAKKYRTFYEYHGGYLAYEDPADMIVRKPIGCVRLG